MRTSDISFVPESTDDLLAIDTAAEECGFSVLGDGDLIQLPHGYLDPIAQSAQCLWGAVAGVDGKEGNTIGIGVFDL